MPLKHFLIFISFSFAPFIQSLVVGHFLFFLWDIVLLALVLPLFSDSVFLIFYFLLFWSPLFRFGFLLSSQSILLVFDSLLRRSQRLLFSLFRSFFSLSSIFPFRSIFSHNSIFLFLSCLLLWSPLDLLFLFAGSNNIFLILDPLLLWSSLCFCLSLFLSIFGILDMFHSLLFWSKSLLCCFSFILFSYNSIFFVLSPLLLRSPLNLLLAPTILLFFCQRIFLVLDLLLLRSPRRGLARLFGGFNSILLVLDFLLLRCPLSRSVGGLSSG